MAFISSNIYSRYGYLLIAFVALLFSLSFRYFFVSLQNYEEYTEQVSRNLKHSLKRADGEINTLRNALEDVQGEVRFSHLHRNFEHWVYVYRDRDLVYWSNCEYEMPSEYIQNGVDEYAIDTRKGTFVLRKTSLMTPRGYIDIVALIPLFTESKINNEYLKGGYNLDIFPNKRVLRLNIDNTESLHTVYGLSNQPLFSLIFPTDYQYDKRQQHTAVFFMWLAIIFSVLQLYRSMGFLLRANRPFLGLIVMASNLLLLRGLMLYFELPFSGMDIPLFRSDYYASSEFAPSLGDLFFNILALLLLAAYWSRYGRRILAVSYLRKLSYRWQELGLSFYFLLGLLTLGYHFSTLKSLYINSQLSLDIGESLDFSLLRIVCYAIFMLVSLTYFLVMHAAFYAAESAGVSRVRRLFWTALMIFATPLFSFFDFSWDEIVWLISLHIIYMWIGFLMPVRLSERSLSYQTFLYLFAFSMLCAILGAYTIYKFEQRRDRITKEKFADKILVENDLPGEYFMHEALQRIEEDPLIRSRMIAPLLQKDVISKKIRRFYLGNYFDKYEVSVLLFNGAGTPYEEGVAHYDSLEQKWAIPELATEYPNIFFINDISSGTKRYLCFLHIEPEQSLAGGRLILDLRLKKIIPNSVYPNLLLDQRFAAPSGKDAFSYAIFSDEAMVYSYGNFELDKALYEKFLNYKTEDKALISYQSRTYLILSKNDKLIVIASAVYPLKRVFSNISFLFLILTLTTLSLTAIYRLAVEKRSLRLNLTGRIQLYLNMAFFLPVLLISVLIISVLNSENKNEIIEAYYEKAENVSQNLTLDLERYIEGKLSRDRLLEQLIEIAKLTQTEINLFDAEGKLLVSSQPVIYDNGLLIRRLNPEAVASLLESNQQRTILNESVGSLEFSSAYVSLRSPQSATTIGVIGLPFFESQQRAQQQIIEILTTIMNVFTGMFIALLGFSYLASRILTEPLKLLTQKIQRTSLSQENKPLEYRSKDEIGLLVNEYNQMLLKLEESKAALARSEKESAWREMAKQVAHEIKNPLTPMRLTLQHLDRILGKENKALQKSVSLLIGQIDTLSDIASSFSAFAKMPIPKNEKFDVSEVLQNSFLLYKNDGSVRLSASIDQGEFIVGGDSKLMGRILTNLIINGIQATPTDREAHIHIELQGDQEEVLITIRDNGKGIDKEVASKIFLPNFTTKSTGSGIGLAVAKRGVEHAGGEIWFETEVGEGTVFYIRLPLIGV
ncbi:MAG: HAMP domain-containing histidine kinase [Bernardetiaceae bacterium]|nr:HAMP domain-containing histidine kinase [Bernardetiaceae bacterium]